MAAIGTPVYGGSSNIPFWLAANTPIPSPVQVTDNLTKQTIITTSESGATIGYNDIPATTQPYASIALTKASGINGNASVALQTNGKNQFVVSGGGNPIVAYEDMEVQDQAGNTLTLSPAGISYNGNVGGSIVLGSNTVDLGGNVEISGATLSVFTAGPTLLSVQTPNQLLFGSNAGTTTNNLQDFSTATITTPPGWNTTPTFGGITWTEDSTTSPVLGGLTKTNPTQSTHAVTTSGAYYPGVGQGIWLSGPFGTTDQVNALNGFLLPSLVAPVSSAVTLTFSYVGPSITAGYIRINGIQVGTIASSSTWVQSSTSFYATGNDEVEIVVKSPTACVNISYINFSYRAASFSPYGSIGVGSVSQSIAISQGPSNVITLGDAGNGITINPGGSGTLTLSGTLNMSGNNLSNVGTFSASTLSATSSVNTPLLDNNLSSLVIGSGSTSVEIDHGSNIYTFALDAAQGTSLYLGAYPSTSNIYVQKLTQLIGVGGGGLISNVSNVNANPACPNGNLQFLRNFSGYHIGSLTLIPKVIDRTTAATIYGSSYTGNEFVSNQGVSVPAYCVFTYGNTYPTPVATYSNTSSHPQFYSDSGFFPSSSQWYGLYPIMV